MQDALFFGGGVIGGVRATELDLIFKFKYLRFLAWSVTIIAEKNKN